MVGQRYDAIIIRGERLCYRKHRIALGHHIVWIKSGQLRIITLIRNLVGVALQIGKENFLIHSVSTMSYFRLKEDENRCQDSYFSFELRIHHLLLVFSLRFRNILISIK